MSEYHHDVFLSYARLDQGIELDVERLAKIIGNELLRLAGREGRLFIDRSISSGEDWPERLRDALECSRTLLACVSPAYLESHWCRREWDFFRKREEATSERLIFPVRLRTWDRTLKSLSDDVRGWADDVSDRQMPEIGELLGADQRPIERLVASMLASMGPARGSRISSEIRARVPVRLGTNREPFASRFAKASRVTVVGVTHQNLTEMLERALRLRLEENREPWSELRIVFLDHRLLRFVLDELSEIGTVQALAEEREKLAQKAKTELSRFLENRLGTVRWSIHEYPYLLPFVGAFFDLPGGQKVAQVATLPLGRRGGDAIYLEFDSFTLPGETAHLESSFETIISASTVHDEMIVMGRPEHDVFVVSGGRARRQTWQGNTKGESVAAIVALLWQRGPDGSCRPVLQVRTRENSRRESDHLSHVSGFVNCHDLGRSRGSARGRTLSEADERRAVNREVGEELKMAERCWGEPVRVGSARYLFADASRESFVFFLYSVELSASIEDLPVPAEARLAPWNLEDLVELRHQQVVRLTRATISARDLSRNQLTNALEIARLNLRLHEEATLAAALAEAMEPGGKREELIRRLGERLQELSEKAPFVYTIGNRDQQIRGLAGLQYREFFSKLVPAYARIGVAGAVELANRTSALAEVLSGHYQNPVFVRTVPVGLDGLHGG